MRGLYISAAHKSSGKTTLSIGLCRALADRGLRVRPFKKGPDYIDPLWLGAAARRVCRNLDFYTQSEAEIRRDFAAEPETDLALIEGNKGLFDGLDLHGSNSNAALAHFLDLPVVLVLDVRGTIRGVAPLLLGYRQFDPAIRFAGVILNRVGGPRHESKLREVIGHYTDFEVLGAVHADATLMIDERHLGLIPSNEANGAETLIERLGRRIAEQVDLDHLLARAGDCALLPPAPAPAAQIGSDPVRIGIPRDRAFGFYYADDLERLARAGARLCFFDALHDPSLPEVDGLFIGGGFPETAMEGLERNQPLRGAIRDFIEAGGPVYAECGGLMYLARTLSYRGRTCEMVGAIPGDVVMHERPQGRGYVRLRENGNGPWRVLADTTGGEIPAHEFHYSSLERLAPGARFAFDVVRGHGIDGAQDGYLYKNLLANYTHLRAVGNNRWTDQFVAFVRRCRDQARSRPRQTDVQNHSAGS